MENMFSTMGRAVRHLVRRPHPARVAVRATCAALVVWSCPAAAPGALAQEQLLFPAVHNAKGPLLERIRNERVRIDVAVWLLDDREITQALVDKHRAGVPVRVIGDRVAVFESASHTGREFSHLASNGVPVRLRYFPTSFPEIMHWKATIFVGQNVVEFGSANYTTFELAPWSPTNFKDETALFTDDPALVRAFLTMFDRMWANTDRFLNWPDAYRRETGEAWTTPMSVSPTRLEPDYPTNVPGMVWSQGPDLIRAMLAEIEREGSRIDLVSYRLTDPGLTEALIRRHRAGVPVRVFIEPTQYRNRAYPEYWMVGTMADRLWAAGVPVKQRLHQGLTHMKSLITSNVALVGSSNFTRKWERDHNYFIAASAKPALYSAMRDRFDAMWNDGANYTAFSPLPPDPPALQSPANGAAGVSNSTLVWRGAPWAVAFDVYLGPGPQALSFAGRVNAVISEEPPQTYSFTPPQRLDPSTTYYWQVVSRTAATHVNPTLVASSDIRSFTTGGSGATGTNPPASCVGTAPAADWTCVNGAWIPPGGYSPPTPPPPTPPQPAPQPPDSPDVPSGPAPAPPSSASCPTMQPAPGWVCVDGGWVPPDWPGLVGGTPAPSPGPAPSPPPTGGNCTTLRPAPDWICVGDGWVPPDWPGLVGGAPPPSPAPVPAPSPVPSAGACTTIRPGPSWVCVSGNWLPPGSPLATVPGPTPAPPPPSAPGSCAGPDPFVAFGGGVCVNGGWVPRGHPLASGGR